MTTHALPAWVTPVAVAFLALAVLSAAAVAYDVWGRGHRQRVPAMDVVWVLSALWLGPFVLPLYRRVGRPATARGDDERPGGQGLGASAATGGLLGGAASLVGHLVGVPVVLASGLSLFGVDMYAMIAVIAVLAIALLASFELVARRADGQSGRVAAAVAAAALTVVAFDVGMGGWMLVLHLNGLMPPLASADFVFLMQVGIVLGFLTGLPAVALLARRGNALTA